MTNNKTKLLFDKLEKASNQKDFIYLDKFAEQSGFTEEEIEKIAKESEEYELILEIAKDLICIHAEKCLTITKLAKTNTNSLLINTMKI